MMVLYGDGSDRRNRPYKRWTGKRVQATAGRKPTDFYEETRNAGVRNQITTNSLPAFLVSS
jgi:hypothetical protein